MGPIFPLGPRQSHLTGPSARLSFSLSHLLVGPLLLVGLQPHGLYPKSQLGADLHAGDQGGCCWLNLHGWLKSGAVPCLFNSGSSGPIVAQAKPRGAMVRRGGKLGAAVNLHFHQPVNLGLLLRHSSPVGSPPNLCVPRRAWRAVFGEPARTLRCAPSCSRRQPYRPLHLRYGNTCVNHRTPCCA
jgi:hypothetical protein